MKGTIWCLHGAVGMADDWKGFAVPGWSVKRVDLWRFLDCCPMSMPEFGAALNREMEATEGPRVLLGYSMGGRLALHALLEGAGPCRSSWDAAVIVSAHPGLASDEERSVRRASDAEWASRALSGDWEVFLERWNGQSVLVSGGNEAVLADRRVLVQRRQAVARSFMDWTLGGQDDLSGEFKQIGCPVLWIVGETDEKFRQVAQRAGLGGDGERAGFPELRVVPGAGHRVPWESPEVFAEIVGEFLERSVS